MNIKRTNIDNFQSEIIFNGTADSCKDYLKELIRKFNNNSIDTHYNDVSNILENSFDVTIYRIFDMDEEKEFSYNYIICE